MQSYNFQVIPKENSNWDISSASGSYSGTTYIDYRALSAGKTVNLYYEIWSDSEFEFAENGTIFTDAKDNFNYQLTSLVANSGRSLILTITNIAPHQALSDALIDKLKASPREAVEGTLNKQKDYEINFRLVAKKKGDNTSLIRYFSQDPAVIIQEMEPSH
ncbi:hypothetical protein OE749_16720 [Aestuariibacter sp. AA17]|uniref:Uncharacterized protein n=1 Tax=Fluctibacter corallii TaxID=2984329 RepID=A0ABT3ACJ1_9ALTE|nr:hypothetical protein [Aestuariibacter sp. AA17]MCV2886340.1 hypothetical protein [Aestuariibacter sp. AA17]